MSKEMHQYIQGIVYNAHLLHGACIYVQFCTAACCGIQPAKGQEKNEILGILLGNYQKNTTELIASARETPRKKLNLEHSEREESEFAAFFSGDHNKKLNLRNSECQRPTEETEFVAFCSRKTERRN
jgi:hypothetical protein